MLKRVCVLTLAIPAFIGLLSVRGQGRNTRVAWPAAVHDRLPYQPLPSPKPWRPTYRHHRA
jgi:hypothetical protein